MNLIIGSGDIGALLMDKNTKGFQDLVRKFVAEDKPYYNALASPIDQLRTGAVLEERYFQILPEGYYLQYKVTSKEMDVFCSSLDFAFLDKNLVVDFDELKTLSLTDFLEIIEPLRDTSEVEYLPVIKKTFKKYYNQIQCQLFCSDLEAANLVFLAVESYEDAENYYRDILPNDFVSFRIKRDETVISLIKERGKFFQDIKDYLTQ